MPGFTEEDVKKYMQAILPDDQEVLARRIELRGKETEVQAWIVENSNGSWKTISTIGEFSAPTVEEFFRKYPQFAVLEWKRLFDDPRFG